MEITINYSDMKFYSEELEALIHRVLEKERSCRRCRRMRKSVCSSVTARPFMS